MLLIALLLLAQPDPCSWLAPGASFAPPQRSTAVPAYSGQAPGTRCEYAGNGGTNVELIVYVDHSPAEAQVTFQKLSAFYPATSKPTGIGDAAYFDQQHAIHVLKGKTRFYIRISSSDPDATREKQARDFATSIVAKL